MLPILTEYIKLYKQFHEQYGDKTVVLMQVGSFYEIYGIDNDNEKVGNAVEVAKILNIVLTRKNKNIPENNANNPLMSGFPCLALDKFIPILLEENYTIIVVDQDKSNLNITRKISNIISPATYTENNEDNYLSLLYVEQVKKDLYIGISTINVITGKSIVHECFSIHTDPNASLDDTISFMKQYPPREIVIVGYMSDEIIQYLELESDNILCHKKELAKKALDIHYQNAVLGDVFKNDTMMSNIEFLNLESKMYALTSFVLLLEFVYSHNPMIIRKLCSPEIYTSSNHLVLETNTVDQLDIVSRSKKQSLFSVINKCSTTLGKRLLKKRLLSPIFDTNKLEIMYQQITDFGNVSLPDIEKKLSKIHDIERLHRRLLMKIITSNELYMLIVSYNNILDIDNILLTYKKTSLKYCIMSNENKQSMKQFLLTCNETFVIDNLSVSYKDSVIRAPIFRNGVFRQVDVLQEHVDMELNNIVNFMNELEIPRAQLDYLHNVGYYINISSSKAKNIDFKQPKYKHLVIKSNKMSTRITSHDINVANNHIILHSESLKKVISKCFNAVLEYFAVTHSNIFDNFSNFVSNIDVIKSNYKTSKIYNYCRPTIVQSDNSFFTATNLRHPIIERIDNGLEYVPNDISLGNNTNGIILYSMNSCGKSSLLKACGLSVILAQIGSFVPATRFHFNPFHRIMTRILSQDNMVKGHSSFVAEMLELRSILKRATDSSTLVLADEITHGTEHTSGSAIFVSCVEMLAKRNVNFMFTTHLHNIYPYICDILNVKVFHLSIYFQDDRIVFERKLKPGPGDSIYGLEVCDFLNMDKEFISRAFEIRNKITPLKTDPGKVLKMSPYNKKVPVKCCQVCGYAPKAVTDIPLDIHHIKEQSLSDCNGMINGIHKDVKSNLTVLCKKCHQKVHRRELEIDGYIQTMSGSRLCIKDF
jgi:DNA mismatch repair protein MutS